MYFLLEKVNFHCHVSLLEGMLVSRRVHGTHFTSGTWIFCRFRKTGGSQPSTSRCIYQAYIPGVPYGLRPLVLFGSFRPCFRRTFKNKGYWGSRWVCQVYVLLQGFMPSPTTFVPSGRGVEVRAFENELGVQPPLGFWDPAGLSSDPCMNMHELHCFLWTKVCYSEMSNQGNMLHHVEHLLLANSSALMTVYICIYIYVLCNSYVLDITLDLNRLHHTPEKNTKAFRALPSWIIHDEKQCSLMILLLVRLIDIGWPARSLSFARFSTEDGDAKEFYRRRVVEIKHGRVSMLACTGISAWYDSNICRWV